MNAAQARHRHSDVSRQEAGVEITRQIETDISFYLVSFMSVHVGLGVAIAIATALLGMPNPM